MHTDTREPNHLIHEKSPYLLQHAYNPVNWYPWKEEAFAKAKSEDKPIFLSIGYSTCHWCHVMERESFEDQEVANILNQHYIAIKVDKEERPDVDNIYMTVCQALNGHGGWPLTILMTPDQQPFYAGTYLPKESHGQMIGLMQLLTTIASMWKTEREKVLSSSKEITDALQNAMADGKDAAEPDKRFFGSAYYSFRKRFDDKYGGFGEAPKFPSPHNLVFLLRYAIHYKEDHALYMVSKTLEAMFRGGIYDHIGGGFSRYSTDEYWLVPHFEKMLYDNALLVMTYAEAYQVTKNPLYASVIQDTLQYVMAEMTDETGGFYCAQDADSEGEEGKYYVFTPDEIREQLGEADGDWFNEQYDISDQGNFEERNIPNLITMEDILKIQEKSKPMREKLYQYRLHRMKLHKDDKILTSWNSLMIVAFAKAYQVLGDSTYLRVAEKACQFLEEQMRDAKGRLFIRYRDGDKQGLGNLDDYAFFIYAKVTLYEVTFDPSYLCSACKDADQMIDLFWDQEKSGFYFYGSDAEQLLLRPKEVYDGAIPSGNSVAGYVMSKLAKMTRNDHYRLIAKYQLEFLAGEIAEYPAAYTFAVNAMMFEFLDEREIVCVIKNQVDLDELRQLLKNHFLPSTIVIPVEEHTKEGLALVAPYVLDYSVPKEESQIYICENYNCHPPMSGMEKLKEYLNNHKK